MIGDLKAGALFNRGDDAFDEAAGDGGHGAAALAADVLVMLAGGLVAGLAVAEVDLFHRAVALELADGPVDRGEVGSQPAGLKAG